MKFFGAKYNLNKTYVNKACRGFSLAELITALTIGSMVLISVLGIYGRAERSAAAVERRLDVSQLPSEVMQRIAEDLDGIISSGSGTQITIENKYDHGLPSARLTITKTFSDNRGQEETFETIVWQSGYDFESNIDGLVLYRSHSGIAMEDKLLDKNKEDWEKELFVPICAGLTFFRIGVPVGRTVQDRWTSSTLPAGIEVTLSFAEPFKIANGTLDVPDEEKLIRTIAIDRTRKIRFSVDKRELGQGEEEEEQEKVEEGGEEDVKNETKKSEVSPDSKKPRSIGPSRTRRTR
ncbi:MAG: prepilin-type N-terminal cleavage/methylation domain-containing protein [Phycisphaerales bacterium]|jgi:prepilin-type N-terminal cleavage/methylation domain-containing protein